MKLKVYVPDPLNEQASVLVDAQTDIKTAIKEGVLSGASFSVIKESVRKVIVKALSRIRSPTLKEDAEKSLVRFANEAYARFVRRLVLIPREYLPAVIVLMRAITAQERPNATHYVPQTAEERRAADTLSYHDGAKGVPLQEFQKDYMEKVSSALDELAKETAKDPNDVKGRNSLRNLAEMQVRYERHQEEIAGLKASGARLVVCSVHADCSGRCYPYQGRVYSLDGTSGKTEDGRDFQPLENATDIYYTTKAGRTYKNGLLGFNCRHKLFEYRVGMGIPSVSQEEQKREYTITRRQREMERQVIAAREEALAKKGANVKEYREWRKIAKARYDAYKKFSKDNGRAYYPDRVKIL